MTIYQAIFKSEKFTLQLEYLPSSDGTIEIVSAHLTERPQTPFELRRQRKRRGLVLDEMEQAAEAMQPYTAIEK